MQYQLQIAVISDNLTFLSFSIVEGDTPHLLVRSIEVMFGRYAVRKGSVRSTQKFCYIVRRHQFLILKGPIIIKKHKKRDIQTFIQSQKYLYFARSLRWRCLGSLKQL